MNDEPLITKKELAVKCNVSSKTIENWAKRGMPVYEIGTRGLRYRYTEVVEWLSGWGKSKNKK